MEPSPGGNTIEYVDGEPQGIIDRGDDITKLGQEMLDSADVLENVEKRAMGADGQKGKAIDSLRESIGDSYTTLREAGNLYKPVGPVISDYGTALRSVKTNIKDTVDECVDLWDKYVSLPGHYPPIGGAENDSGDSDDSGESDDEAKKDAYLAWKKRAGDFDDYYNTWEQAFDDACGDITTAMSDSIEDGWWDNWGSDVFEVLNTILSIAGLIAGIVAMFVSGAWIVALVIGIAALAVTAMRFAHDEASGLDLALAVVGVVPFGKLTKVFSAADEVAGATRTATAASGGANGLSDLAGVSSTGRKFVNGLLRVTNGQSADEMASLMRNMENLGAGRQFLVSQLFVGGKIQHIGNLYGWGNTVFGAPSSVPTAYNSGQDVYDYVTAGDHGDGR